MGITEQPTAGAEAATFEEEVAVLVLRAQAGDSEAFARVFTLLQPRLERQALFLAGNNQQALDLLQDTMLECWKHLGRYDGRARFFAWTCGIMAHRHYDWYRRLRVRAFTVFAGALEESVPDPGASPSDISAELDRTRVVRRCLDRLPAKQRMVVYLRFYAGESLEGIGAIAQCSVGTVKSRLFHALDRLAKMERLKDLRNEL